MLLINLVTNFDLEIENFIINKLKEKTSELEKQNIYMMERIKLFENEKKERGSLKWAP